MIQIKNGFTLIELVIVIIILGILTVVAAPKFISIDKDAKIASLKGVKGALESAFTDFQAKTYMPSTDLEFDEYDRNFMTINGEKIQFTKNDHKPVFFVLRNDTLGRQKLNALVDIDLGLKSEEPHKNLLISFGCSASGGFYIYPKDNEDLEQHCGEAKKCYLKYIPSNDAHDPQSTSHFILNSEDC